jgi:hypothetical protein
MYYNSAMECIESYLNLTMSYKDYYIKNNDLIKEENPTFENLLFNIYHDVDIILCNLNISPSKYGYTYWRDAIFIMIVSENQHLSICNEIYPLIAKKYNKSAISVERAMRLCFENAMYDNSKKRDDFIVNYMKNYLLYPHNSEILVKLTELVVSREFQKNKSCVLYG